MDALARAGKLLRFCGDLALHTLAPSTCAHCKADLGFRRRVPLCAGCASGLKPMPELFCRVCGVALPDGGAHCHNCKSPSKRRLDRCELVRSAFLFTPQLRSLIHAMKYRSRAGLAVFMAEASAPRLASYEELSVYEALAPVPLSLARLRERGFNQSLLIARALSGLCGKPVLEEGLKKVRHTPSQASLDAKARLANLEGAFEACGDLSGRRILLVDDVATTGATLESCAAALRKAGAKSVAGFTVARE